jgi:predicted TIM-barrel fold metal-dependent hydrolase
MGEAGCYLVREEHVPSLPRFPAVDAHNHLWGDLDRAAEVVAVLDSVGIMAYADLTANITIAWGEGGYTLGQGDFGDFVRACAEPFPGRFFGFTTATFAQPVDRPLFTDADDFVRRTIDLLTRHTAEGARGLKILKELGLHYRDGHGDLVRIDDERLDPVWACAGELGIPVLMHQSDPVGFFEPVTPANEHCDSLLKYPTWSFCASRFPRKAELLERRDRVVRRHPDTVFILPHVANFPEDLGYVSRLLDENPNVMIDLSARCDELGRQPYSAREFLIRYQDRVLFGTDMPPSRDMYRFHFRFLETFDEFVIPPDYDGSFGRHRWRVHCLGLPDEVLRKIYSGNALRVIPGLSGQLGLQG